MQLLFQSDIHSDFIYYIAFSLVADFFLMKFDTAPYRNWFGYTRRERRASFILLILIVSVVSVRFLFPEKNTSVENIPIVPEVNETVRTSFIQEYPKKRTVVVDINRCDTSELIKLPGIGPVLSLRIIKYRNLLGGYVRKDQLREVYGLPAETYDLIKDKVYVDTLIITTIDINSADFRTLVRFPYFDKSDVTSILKYRELEGRISSIEELVDNKLISEEKAGKVRSYLRF
ncbi:MAG TPA: hypothetical protein DDY34_04390 [Bacteroidales bacterium]|nr:hypothetical protein [Bacteroidales bacterium]